MTQARMDPALVVRNRARVEAATEALGRIGDEEALWPLADLLERREEPGLVTAAAKAIGFIGGQEAVRLLAQHVEDEDSAKREAAMRGLAATHHPDALATLWPYLWDEDPKLREIALAAAAIRPVSYLADSMLGVLSDETPENREVGLKILEASLRSGRTTPEDLERFLPRATQCVAEKSPEIRASLEKLSAQAQERIRAAAPAVGAPTTPIFTPVRHRVLDD